MTFVADMLDRIKFRPAEKEESRTIAHLFSISSDGVADYTWKTLADPGEEVLDVGERRYSCEISPFSYENCTVAEIGGEIVAMIAAFPIETVESNDGEMDVDLILAPYTKLEQPNSYYIAGLAVFPEYRGKGYGSKFLEIAEQQAKNLGLSLLSLIVFEQNEDAKRLYDRHVYYEIGREKVVPHELIHVTGYALLMVKDI